MSRRSGAGRLFLGGLVLMATLALGAGSCLNPADNDPSTPPCSISLSGDTELTTDVSGEYTLTRGSGWSGGVSVEWAVAPTGAETVTDNGDENLFEVSFSEAGTYEITATLTESADDDTQCEEGSESITVVVSDPPADCDVEIAGPTALLTGQRGDYSFTLGGDWDAGRTVEWSVTPETNVTVHEESPTSYGLSFSQPGTYTVSLDVTDESPGASCAEGSDDYDVVVTESTQTEIPTGSFTLSFGAFDGVRIPISPSWRALLDSEAPAFVASENGVAAIDLFNRTIIENGSLAGDSPLANPPLGSLLMRAQYREEEHSLLEFRMDGATLFNWDESGGTWSVWTQSIAQTAVTDATNFIGGEEGCLFVMPYWGIVQQLAWNGNGYGQTSRIVGGDLPYAGDMASAVGSEVNGSILVATGGTPGEIWLWHDSGSGFEATDLGDVGDTPRRLRTLNGIAVLTNFGSGTITILTWDGAGSAAIVGTQAVGDGPVGVDLLPRAGGGVFALTTGWNDDTYTITEIDGAGAVVASNTTALPAGHLQPAHGIWLHDADESFIVSCFGSGHLFVERR